MLDRFVYGRERKERYRGRPDGIDEVTAVCEIEKASQIR